MTADFITISMRITFSSIIFLFFIFEPLTSRYRYSRLKTKLLVSSLIVLSIAVSLLLLTIGTQHPKSVVFIIIVWISYAVSIFHLTIKGSLFEGIFIVLVVLNLYANIITIAKLLANMSHWGISQHVIRAIIATGVLILYIPLLWILMFKLYKSLIEFQTDFSAWKYIWVVPALTYLIFYVKIRSDYWNDPIQVTAQDVIFNILWSLSSYVFFCVTLLLLLQTNKSITAMEQARIITVQLNMQEEQYRQLLDSIEQSARFRHDWRHQLLTINGLAKEQKLDELKQFIAKLMPVCLNEGDLPICENHVVNIILQHYRAMADAKGIKIKISADIPQSLPVPDMDLCIIFGNLVENSIEACINQKGTDKFIDIKTAVKEKLLVVTIKNTYSRKVILKDNIYYSTKHEGRGMGLPSVRRVVEKNKGYLQIRHDNGCFCVNILLNTN